MLISLDYIGALDREDADARIQVVQDGKPKYFRVKSLMSQNTTTLSIPFAEFNAKQEICLNEKALELLRTIKKPVAVLTICGPYRTGKSYYLSRVLDNNMVFRTSQEIGACTQGMWMATMILECEDFAIVLIDTEGTDSLDVGKDREMIVRNYIVLSSLLSSVLVYNTKGAPSQSAVDKMR